MAKFYELVKSNDTTIILNLDAILTIEPNKETGITLVDIGDFSVDVTHHSLMLALEHAQVPYMVLQAPEAPADLADVDTADVVDETVE